MLSLLQLVEWWWFSWNLVWRSQGCCWRLCSAQQFPTAKTANQIANSTFGLKPCLVASTDGSNWVKIQVLWRRICWRPNLHDHLSRPLNGTRCGWGKGLERRAGGPSLTSSSVISHVPASIKSAELSLRATLGCHCFSGLVVNISFGYYSVSFIYGKKKVIKKECGSQIMVGTAYAQK